MTGIIEESANFREFLCKTNIFLPGNLVRKCVIAVALACLAVAVVCATAHAQAPNPFKIAAEHAQKAVDAKDLAQIHLHLHHVLNCLEGSRGRDYKNVADNPCTGKGALQTLPKHSADLVRAEKAIAIARVAVTLHDTKPAHYAAQAVRAILTESKQK